MERPCERVAVIVLHEGQILLMYRVRDGEEYYCLPGGHVKPSESLEQAALREIREETTLAVRSLKFFCRFDNQNRMEHYFVAHEWTGKAVLGGPELERHSPENFYRLEWVALDRLPTINLMPPEIRTRLVEAFCTSSQCEGQRQSQPVSSLVCAEQCATQSTASERPRGTKPSPWGRMRAWWLTGRGDRLLSKGRTDEAAECFRRAASLAPSAGRLLHLAIAQADAADTQPAVESARQAVHLAPCDAFAHSVLAILFAERGERDKAAVHLEAASAARPGHPMARAATVFIRLLEVPRDALSVLAVEPVIDNPFVRARFLAQLEIIARSASNAAAEFSEARSDNAERTQAGSPVVSKAPRASLWARLLGRSPRQLARGLARRGLRQFENQKVDNGVDFFRRALVIDPSCSEARLYLGCALFELERYGESVALLKEFVQEKHVDELALFYYGAASCRLGRYEEALAALDRVAAGQREYDFQEWLPYFRGVALLGLGRRAEALAMFRQACDMSWSFLQHRAGEVLVLLEHPCPH